MSESRCCCNCRHNIRTSELESPLKLGDIIGSIKCHCEIDGHYIGYVECFEGWCRRWASDAKKWEGAEDE